jgi:hypothetical protein
MIRAEWLACPDGVQMLMQMPRGQSTPRKSLLLHCGCLRYQVEHNRVSWVGDTAIFAPAKDLNEWLTRAEAAADGNPSIRNLYSSSIPGQKALYWVPREAIARVLRDLHGYPFEPGPVCDDWLTPTVVALAQTIENEKSFDVMSILADALEDSGCTDEHVLWHCRREFYHFRGCWVLDAILWRRTGSWRDQYRLSDRVKATEIPFEKVVEPLRPCGTFAGNPFLIGDDENGYVISAWVHEDVPSTLTCDDDPLYFAMTEHLLANGVTRFSSADEARSAHSTRVTADNGR